MCFKLLEDTLEIHNGLETANKTVCVWVGVADTVHLQ